MIELEDELHVNTASHPWSTVKEPERVNEPFAADSVISVQLYGETVVAGLVVLYDGSVSGTAVALDGRSVV